MLSGKLGKLGIVGGISGTNGAVQRDHRGPLIGRIARDVEGFSGNLA